MATDARVTQLAGQALYIYLPNARMTQLGGQILVHRCEAPLGIGNDMLMHLDCNVTNLCTLWKVTSTAGTIIRYCNHTRDITYNSELYTAFAIQPSSFDSTNTLAANNQEIISPVTATGFSEFDLLSGKWDFARVEISVINYLNPAYGHARRIVGKIGEVTFENGRFIGEFRGLTQLLDQELGDLASPTCRAILGDAACGVNLAPFTHATSVTQVQEDYSIFHVGTTQANGYFRYGKATFTSGDNNGISAEIKDNIGARIVLMLPLFREIDIGDNVTLIRGCDKTRTTCRDVFNNTLRMRAEPDLPGRDKVLKFPRKPTPYTIDTE
jgi:uncharacterized phage protein (TIGR02218 family)